ncbi:S-adenosyl-L-methionine-dependent methyltransferases superfamilyprotein [Zostera marina]|uniref:S-adenosyl-L-methionine-dependent methyltransferases superfamilyprotein n=1 Tax=Zostera marina TaxID=29655 RepID=A0A0K9P5R0_ZOSMR|nr:S-adenosyl-L-methionine-dependent methyltransferases superfamilyprotein [Zostera marina]
MAKFGSRIGSVGVGMGVGGGNGNGSRRDWTQIYAIYGISEESRTLIFFLLFHASLFGALSTLVLMYFAPILTFLEGTVITSSLPFPLLRFILGFSGSVAAISSICLLFAAGNVLNSSLALHWDMCQRVVAAVPDWSVVRTVLHVGCGTGVLLNSVAMQLKKEGSRGRVVGLDHRKGTAVAALRTACLEGVQEYVTCREGDARRIPFADGHFDAVVSAVHLSSIGKTVSGSSAEAVERSKAVGEVVRVLRPGGVGVVWDVGCSPDYVQRLRELRMEDIHVSRRATSWLVTSHIVSFRKPLETTETTHDLLIRYHQQHYNNDHRPLDWRTNVIIPSATVAANDTYISFTSSYN